MGPQQSWEEVVGTSALGHAFSLFLGLLETREEEGEQREEVDFIPLPFFLLLTNHSACSKTDMTTTTQEAHGNRAKVPVFASPCMLLVVCGHGYWKGVPLFTSPTSLHTMNRLSLSVTRHKYCLVHPQATTVLPP